jgi:tRNA (guanine26-N2/guanine27-N2)-dimethyltransferase
VAGPMWSGPMHDEAFVHAMEEEAAVRGWDDAEQLLRLMGEEARAEMGGALLFYHLGEVQRSLAARGLRQPPLAVLIEALRAAGHTASASHSERKAIKVSATLDQIVEVVAAAGRQGETK